MVVASRKRIVLNLGAGHAPFPLPDIYPSDGWREIRVDADPSAMADVQADLERLPFEDGSADAIVCMGVLEHFPEPSIPKVLGEMHRVLCEAGELKLLVPDLMAICRVVATGNLTNTLVESPSGPVRALDMLYGFSPMLAEHPLWSHRTGFTWGTLATVLSQCGFAGRVFTEADKAPFMLLADVFKK